MDIKIPKLDFPTEEVLQFIENNRRISITRDAYVSREHYNCHHPEGKHTPAYSANSGKGDGSHVILVDLEGINYPALHCGKDQKGPIELHRPGRNREQ